MSQTPKSAGLLETSEADLTPSIALGVTRPKRLNSRSSSYQRAPAQNGAGQLRGPSCVDGHTSALTHRSIPLSPTSGYVSVAGITGVCDEEW